MKLNNKCKFEITPVPPFDFELTVKKPAGWTLFNSGEIFHDGTLWTASRIQNRLVGLKLRSIGTVSKPRIRVALFTAKPLMNTEKTDLKALLMKLIGAEQDLREFYGMARKDKILKHVIEDLYGMHDTQSSYLFNSVVLSICLQMARMDRSMKMMGAITRSFGDKVEFDGKTIVAEPSAEKIARLNPRHFAKKCNLGYRAKYIVEAAKKIVSGFPDIVQVMSMSPDEARQKLTELPGVGDYAADIINPHGGFPIDAWSVDVFGKLFFGKEPEIARDAIEAVKSEGRKRWGKFAWMAFFYIAQDLRNLSKHLGIELRLQ